MDLSLVRLAFLLIPVALACFAPSPQVLAVCQDACLSNSNTVQGDDALISLTTGDNNTAMGFQALFSDTNGDYNTALGWLALQHNTEGLANTAAGADAMRNNTTGDANAAFGMFALFTNSTGSRNTVVGVESLKRNNGSDNIAIGYEAGMNIGAGSNTICIGHAGVTGDSNTIRIGTGGTHTNTFIAGINGVTVAGGVAVVIDADGHLGTSTSSARFKEAIKPMNEASEAILALKPVTFRYKRELDPVGISQFGLVAEEVEKVNPNLVACDEQGKPYTVRYEAVNAMLLNEFLKEHRKNEKQQSKIEQQDATILRLEKKVEALTAGLQKVSAQLTAASPSGGGLELSKSAPQTVLSKH